MKRITILSLAVLSWSAFLASPALAEGKYKNFRVAMYALRATVNSWSDPQKLAADYDEMIRQVKFDKIYLEFAGGHRMVDEAILDPIKKFFTDQGIIVSSAIVPIGISYANAEDRAYLKKVVEVAARHFDEVIFDDWYFTSSKTAADIAAKGSKSWTQYRLEALDEAAVSLLIQPSKAINPKFRLIIKYPNWYEHYQGLGYDLEVEPKLFDGIYAGVETRDPIRSEQHLQQYESYSILRYFENSKPGGADGGWVDNGAEYIDRYAEQIWDMGFAKAREITLWHWADLARPMKIGPRPWQGAETSLTLQKVLDSYRAPVGGGGAGPRCGRVAGYAMEQIDTLLDKLGKPIGIGGYRPPHAIGEEFLYDYLGMIGIPIELRPTFPTESNVCLLTEGAKHDSDIVKKIKGQLSAGKDVVITSGLLHALLGKGIEDISEFEYTDHKVGVTDFQGRGGFAIPGAAIDAPIFFPIIHFLTNQSWGQVNGLDSKSPWNAYPIVISDEYDRGSIVVLAIPDNVADLYRLPAPVLDAIRNQIMGAFPVRLTNAPSQVSIFAYDNNTFVVQSFLPTEITVAVTLAGTSASSKITDLLNGQVISPVAATSGVVHFRGPGGHRRGAPAGSSFPITIPPHSYRAFATQN
jgi:hypothetical protein